VTVTQSACFPTKGLTQLVRQSGLLLVIVHQVSCVQGHQPKDGVSPSERQHNVHLKQLKQFTLQYLEAGQWSMAFDVGNDAVRLIAIVAR